MSKPESGQIWKGDSGAAFITLHKRDKISWWVLAINLDNEQMFVTWLWNQTFESTIRQWTHD